MDLSNINALCLGGGTRCSGRVSVPCFTSYENVKIVPKGSLLNFIGTLLKLTFDSMSMFRFVKDQKSLTL